MITDRVQTTARVYFQPLGVSGYSALGDVAKLRFAPDLKRGDYSAARKGSRLRAQNMVQEIHWRWSVTLHEELDRTLRLLGLAGAATPLIESQTDGELAVAEPGPADQFDLPFAILPNWEYRGDGVPVLGIDYLIDIGDTTTTVFILSSYWEEFHIEFVLRYDVDGVNNYAALKNLRAAGRFRLDEFDQFAASPRLSTSFDGQAILTDACEADGEKPSDFELEITASGPVSVQQRKD